MRKYDYDYDCSNIGLALLSAGLLNDDTSLGKRGKFLLHAWCGMSMSHVSASFLKSRTFISYILHAHSAGVFNMFYV